MNASTAGGEMLLTACGDGETVDVMVADRLPPKRHPKVLQRKAFSVPGGTSALRKTVNCEVTTDAGVVTLSIPDALGSLGLKGAAYLEDSRDRERHLDDAVVLPWCKPASSI